MKILLVSLESYLGFLDTGMLHNYLPLQQLGHEVLLFDYTIHKSKELIDRCKQFKPDLVFYCLSENQVDIEDMMYVKNELKINSIGYFVDSVWRYENYTKKYANGMNYVFDTELATIDKYKSECNIKDAFHVTLFANDNIFYPNHVNKEFDISFVGRFHGNRSELLIYLQKECGIDIKIYTNIKNYSHVNEIYNRSRLVLSPSMSSDNIHKQDKLRFYEIAASGTPFVTDYDFTTNGNSFINDLECIRYSTKEEMFEKIKYYLINEKERNEIAERAYNRFKSEHMSKIKLTRILNLIKEE